jgi:molybdopterin converting factor small subunit
MNIRIRAFARFREIFGEETELSVPDGTTLAGALADLAARSPEGLGALYEQDGVLHRYVVLMKNGSRIGHASADTEVLREGDEVVVYPPVAGG